MAYAAWSVIAGEQPTTSKWNILGTNDSSFNDGSGIAAGAIITASLAAAGVTAAKMKYGLIRQRQGGTTGDASWYTTGTSNTDVSAKDTFIQVGSTNSNTSDVTVTFPVAFTQIPIVVISHSSAASFNGTATAVSVTTTTFGARFLDTSFVARAGETLDWIAIGQ